MVENNYNKVFNYAIYGLVINDKIQIELFDNVNKLVLSELEVSGKELLGVSMGRESALTTYQEKIKEAIEKVGVKFVLNNLRLSAEEIQKLKIKKVTVQLSPETKGLSTIFFDIYTSDKKFSYFPIEKIRINKKFYDAKSHRIVLERVKKDAPREIEFYEKTNALFQTIEDVIISEFHQFLDNNFFAPPNEVLKNSINKRLNIKKIIQVKKIIEPEKALKLNLIEVIENFILKHHAQPSTKTNYTTLKNGIINFLNVNDVIPSSITIEDWTDSLNERYIDFLIQKGNTNNSINYMLVLLNKVFTSLGIKKEKIKLKDTSREKEYLTIEEMDLFKAIDVSKDKKIDFAKDFAIISSLTGLRFSDIEKITPENIILYEGRKVISINVQKTSKLLKIPLSPEVENLLIKHNYNFSLGKFGNALLNARIKIIFKREKDGYFNQLVSKNMKSGQDTTIITKPRYEWFSIHIFRHTFASYLQKKGVNIHVIKQSLGHSNVSTTEKYLHTKEKDIMNALFDALN